MTYDMGNGGARYVESRQGGPLVPFREQDFFRRCAWST